MVSLYLMRIVACVWIVNHCDPPELLPRVFAYYGIIKKYYVERSMFIERQDFCLFLENNH